MSRCSWHTEVARYFDGETVAVDAVETHLRQCPQCAAYCEQARQLREGVGQLVQREQISDMQFPAFMEGIRESITPPSARRHGGLWAALSLSTAALLIAIAAFFLFQGGPEPVRATEVEFVSTELEGATVHWYGDEGGITTVEINLAEDDIL